MHCPRFCFRVALACVLFSAVAAFAQTKLSPLFTDNMVLQQGMAMLVWGTAAAGDKITVTLGDQTMATDAGPDGHWQVKLHALTAGGPYVLRIAGAADKISLSNVLVGEVWFCSGQSNMALPLSATTGADQEIPAANNPQLRMYTESITDKDGWPILDTAAHWQECSAKTVAGFSAAAYYFGRDLQKALNVPVGLIHASVGGSRVDAWTDMATLQADPDAKPILDRWAKDTANFPKQNAAYQAALQKWAANQKGGKPPRRPYGPGHTYEPAGLFNRYVASTIPYAIRGVIWYQGESDRDRGYQYRQMFPQMIGDWRKNWNQGDFPFLYVQLPGFEPKPTTRPYADQSAIAELREAQLLTLSAAPNTGMIITTDIADARDNIHPKNKVDVGHRLALVAERVAYGKDVVCSGPIYQSRVIDGDKVTLTFDHSDGGLKTHDGAALTGFAIAGQDKQFFPAEATIVNGKVIVHSDKVSTPAAVRYAWEDFPVCSLTNGAGLPASPFRTDDWPGVSIDKR